MISLVGMPNKITCFVSKPLFVWKVLTKSRVRRSGLAICTVLSISALFLRKKRSGSAIDFTADRDVEDLTVDQQRMLSRVREIWNEQRAGAHSMDSV
jgi:hypothetical protein